MKTLPLPRDIYAKFQNGDSLSNIEVDFGVVFFKDLADKLVLCGPTFSLTFKETNSLYLRLHDMQTARKGKNGYAP